jgi:hypothetical protein
MPRSVGVSTDIRANLDADRLAAGFFEKTWQPIIANQPDAVVEHLDAERAFVASLIVPSAYRTVVEAGCADGSLLASVILGAGATYLGLDVADGAVRACTARLRNLAEAVSARGLSMPAAVVRRADIRDLPAVLGSRGAPSTPPVLAAFPFNVFGNIPEPRDAVKAAASVSADALILTYDTGTGARRLREEYYRACGFAGGFSTDDTGVHYEDELFTSSVYRQPVLTGWLEELGYAVTVTPYGQVGLAYHARRGR